MTSFEEALQLVLRHARPLGSEFVALADADGRVLAEIISAPWNLPLFDNSAMDGYAVRSEDCLQPTRLRILGSLPAGGAASVPLEAGCAIKIMTGAPIPANCDSVIPLEFAHEDSGYVVTEISAQKGKHIRKVGEDIREGEEILQPGTVLGPAAVSMLASCAKQEVAVYRRPRVAILSIGDELLDLGEPLAPGKVINSNGLSLAAAVKACGAIPVSLGIARDSYEDHVQKISQGLEADVLITSAGVSTGARDLVRGVIANLGAKPIFEGVGIRPGSPACFSLCQDKPVFSLPGNPVASLLSFEVLVRPALLQMMGHRKSLRAPVAAILQEEIRKKVGYVQFLRVRLEANAAGRFAYSAGNQNTGILSTMLQADGLAMLPADRSSFSPGEEVEVYLLSEHGEMREPHLAAREKSVTTGEER